MCANLTGLNAITVCPNHPMACQQAIRDEFGGSKVYSALDLKAGFQNVPVEPESQDLLGFVTQDGLWQWARMPFGAVGAPAHFQMIIDTVLRRADVTKARGYLDDISVLGDDWQTVWSDTMRTLKALIDQGFMVNLLKCKFL